MYGGAKAEKQRIRQEVRRINTQLTTEYRLEASRSITRSVLALPAWRKARTVMAFVSLPGEPDTRELMETALREGKTLLLPRCEDAVHMRAYPVEDLFALIPDALGIPAPLPAAPDAEISEPDLILVPCVAASPGGIRLGHGAGYYDRFLEGCGGKTVCLCFRALLRADLPAEDTDVPVDLVISD